MEGSPAEAEDHASRVRQNDAEWCDDFGSFGGGDDRAWEPDDDDEAGGMEYAPLADEDESLDGAAGTPSHPSAASHTSPFSESELQATLAVSRAKREAAMMEAEYRAVAASAERAAAKRAESDSGEDVFGAPCTAHPCSVVEGEFAPFAADERAAAVATALRRRKLVEAFTGGATAHGLQTAVLDEPPGRGASFVSARRVERFSSERSAKIKASMAGLDLKPRGVGLPALESMVSAAVAQGRRYLDQQEALDSPADADA